MGQRHNRKRTRAHQLRKLGLLPDGSRPTYALPSSTSVSLGLDGFGHFGHFGFPSIATAAPPPPLPNPQTFQQRRFSLTDSGSGSYMSSSQLPQCLSSPSTYVVSGGIGYAGLGRRESVDASQTAWRPTHSSRSYSLLSSGSGTGPRPGPMLGVSTGLPTAHAAPSSTTSSALTPDPAQITSASASSQGARRRGTRGAGSGGGGGGGGGGARGSATLRRRAVPPGLEWTASTASERVNFATAERVVRFLFDGGVDFTD